MFVGPIFHRELAITPRRPRLYLYRSVYAAALLILMSTAWLVLAGAQIIRNVGDMARFGTIMFQILAPLQLALMTFFAAMSSASSVAQEKDRRTLILLLMTRMTNSELVVGKLLASLLNVFVMVMTALPIFLLAVLFGGISFAQVARVFAVTLTTALAAGSLGAILAFWREKTFQTLALTALILCFWLGFWKVVGAGVFGEQWFGVSCRTLAKGFSPLQAIHAAARPFLQRDPALGALQSGVYLYLISSLAITALLCIVAMLRVRIWNPSREVRVKAPVDRDEQTESIFGVEHDAEIAGETNGSKPLLTAESEQARAGHVDSQLRAAKSNAITREVWDNPVLWRELRTWAYGRKIIVIRVAYLILVAMAAAALHYSIQAGNVDGDPIMTLIPPGGLPLALLFFVSLVILNALAATSVTTERDGQSLDLLLTTDLSPHEFVFGKLGGIFSVGGLMVIAPLGLTVYLWIRGGMSNENVVFTLIGLLVMVVFVAMLGVHCGMRYSNSRSAIAVSLGTVFFLFVGIVFCMALMVAFNSSFEVQMAPFLAFIVGGGVGLYVALGARNPSKAIALSSVVVPFFTFFAITSFLMGRNLSVFFVTVAIYGFTTAAMLIPALSEFDFDLGKSRTPGE